MKVGDRVVYIGGCLDGVMICPKIDVEVLKIIGESKRLIGHFFLDGYVFAKDGAKQCFHYTHLRKVDDQPSLSKELAEQLKDNPEWVEIEEEVLS